MRRDSLFYRLFQKSPSLLFDLLPVSPSDAAAYRFDSVAIKEPKFEIDGVFLPPEGGDNRTVYFCEVQFQKDEKLYERLFGESFLYFYRQRHRFDDWQAVIIYPARTTEQTQTHPYRALLASDQVHRIYLDELGDPQDLPLGLGLILLTSANQTQATQQARTLVARAQQEITNTTEQQAIIELIITIMVYQFTHISRQEVEMILDIRLQDTRVYQEAREEGVQEGLAQERALLTRMLTRKVGKLSQSASLQVGQLSFRQLGDLGEALLEFQAMADLDTWLNQLTEKQTEVVKKLIQKLGALEASTSDQIKEISLSQLQLLEEAYKDFPSINDLTDWLQAQSKADATLS
ncbi:Rpn family recombination-promoting nuclease/putative transposase [Leptothoe spongobia]|uniref:Rpn family recombination-promoting nuclease/putative transposase n=1 Tax=Leptothoe spongobia TAU-MAC 1115 TaxID=1967444 RepID=A0A947DIG1_9CYAN|nr:Rpn family recombination-promoting nuclease/putative transposase [Leptothoe spongobia]MBT9317618.1 Rpn family recombination-promoting nuclease/putative transposase [Leptothoe spongobia TAU-MAC 1115]